MEHRDLAGECREFRRDAMICQIAPLPQPCLGCLIRELLAAEPDSDEHRDAVEKLIQFGQPLSWIRQLLDWQENVLKPKGADG